MKEIDYINVKNALKDPTRMKMIYVLSKGDFCAIHLEKQLKISQSNISRHAEKLINSKIIVKTKKGRRTIYSLSNWFEKNFENDIELIDTIYNKKIKLDKLQQFLEECKNM